MGILFEPHLNRINLHRIRLLYNAQLQPEVVILVKTVYQCGLSVV